ncbi:MAG: tRNA (uridine(34)/cytosine(34)/5-carboxymethylaminomethyluridine(34)-2'-O)-methyltransferase TrmL [Deltaproteobacteria bacterium]|nr:tRNA (uridine(34)/cytosine(34)/5-carboxymethylaminomethyluridine(34)-2'-O)-methyltransferase TrmL [Deltaproteobacteria bacterium]
MNLNNDPWLHLVLDRPRIIANIASIVRLCAGTEVALHICGPLVFEQNDKTRWRAGLDYFEGARVHFHQDLFRCLKLLDKKPWIIEVGGHKTPWEVSLNAGDVLVLGPETASVLEEVQNAHRERILTLPQPGPVRSLNLAQCAAVSVFEAMRQINPG